MRLLLLLLLALTPALGMAQTLAGSGGIRAGETTDELSPAQRAEIQTQLDASRAALRAAGLLPEPHGARAGRGGGSLAQPLRAFPDLADPGFYGITNYVDLDPTGPNNLLDYNCGARTYDTSSGYDHQGVDYVTWPFPWTKMDEDAVEVVAAADGVIILKADGQFDRQCEFNPNPWNAVYLEHSDGSVGWYGHLKNGSLTSKAVGEPVVAGETLGVVGSSGNSTIPHLHFELYGADDDLVEPFAGPCNPTTDASWWAEQEPYYASRVLALHTHDDPPLLAQCPQTEDTPNFADAFEPGQLAYFGAYYRDQRQSQTTAYSILRPNGTAEAAWTHGINDPHYAISYWYWSYFLPADAPEGTWTFRVEYEGEVVTHPFTVGAMTSDGGAPQAGYRIAAPSPNPFHSATALTVELDRAQRVQAVAYDVLGRAVATLHEGPLSAGQAHRISLDGRALPAGVYVVRLVSEGFAESFPVTLTR